MTVPQNVVVVPMGPATTAAPVPTGFALSGGSPRYHVTSPPFAATDSVAVAPPGMVWLRGCVKMLGSPQGAAKTRSLTALIPQVFVTFAQKVVSSMRGTRTCLPVPIDVPPSPGVEPRNHSY